MDEKTTGIVSYIGLIGLIIAFVMDKDKSPFSRFHIRQNIGINILWVVLWILSIILGSISSILGLIVWVLFLFPFVLWVIGIIGAVQGEKKLVPVLGDKFQEWFKSI